MFVLYVIVHSRAFLDFFPRFARSRFAANLGDARAHQVLDAARGVNADSINKMLGNLKAAGAQFLPSSALLPPSTR